MRKLTKKYIRTNFFIVNLLFFLLLPTYALSNNIQFEIQGNNFTDTDAILSLLDNIPENIDKESTNTIIKVLNQSSLFSDVKVRFENNKYIIIVTEFQNINKLYFDKNERLKDEDLILIADQINFLTYNSVSVNLFINEVKKVYKSFGYNNVIIEYSKEVYEDTNTVDVYFTLNEGSITKINKIFVSGNKILSAQEILAIINSKTKSFRNIFANNNYKQITVERDEYLISEYYKNNGFLDVTVNTKIEYLKSNSVNIYFNITEGEIYSLESVKIIDQNNIINSDTIELINLSKDKFIKNEKIFSFAKIQQFRDDISTIIIESGIEFFEITYLDKIDGKKINVLFQILSIDPKYTNQINIIGNTRTFDYVIRRELDIVEGDAVHKSQIDRIRDKLISLNLFKSVNIKEEFIDENNLNLIIEVEEKQTGTFNAGVSVGTLDGFAIVSGLRESNFYGTGRSVDFLINTSENNNQFKFVTSDRLSYENDINYNYNVNYRQQDLSKFSSYKLDSFTTGIGFGYKLNSNFYHNIDFEYVLKDYQITNSATASNSILSSSGTNMSFLIKNNFRFSSINPGLISKRGNLINFNSTVETPTSSSNGFIRNIITLKQYHSIQNNIFSVQTKLGNVFSLNNNDILTDDKFSLGGRWLRGFDNFGVGPRNSRTSYVGGNNVAVTKLDFAYEISKNSNFPIYLNIFNDYGLLWENKTKPVQSDNSIRSSAGFGIRYYSPIGPIGFTWGFPIIDKEYDIKRMFLFSIGNIDWN